MVLHFLKYRARINERFEGETLLGLIFKDAYQTYKWQHEKITEKDLLFYIRDHFPEDYSREIKKFAEHPAFLCELESPIQDEKSQDSSLKVRCRI